MTHQELWTEALAAWEANGGEPVSALRLASEGHPNARPIVAGELAEATGCTCGADEPCEGVETPERVRLRCALAALLAAMTEPA